MTETYIPEPGHLVRLRRWEVPCPEIPGTWDRRLLIEIDGIVESVREVAAGHLVKLAGDSDSYFTGYQFAGMDSSQGPSWSLRTEVTRRVWVSVSSHRARGKLDQLAGGREQLGPEYGIWPEHGHSHGEYYQVDYSPALARIKGLRVLAGPPRVPSGGRLFTRVSFLDGPQPGKWPVPAGPLGQTAP